MRVSKNRYEAVLGATLLFWVLGDSWSGGLDNKGLVVLGGCPAVDELEWIDGRIVIVRMPGEFSDEKGLVRML